MKYKVVGTDKCKEKYKEVLLNRVVELNTIKDIQNFINKYGDAFLEECIDQREGENI
jgi:hypothetical protein